MIVKTRELCRRMPFFFCALMLALSAVSVRGDSYVDEGEVRAARRAKIKRIAKIAAGVAAVLACGVAALGLAARRRQSVKWRRYWEQRKAEEGLAWSQEVHEPLGREEVEREQEEAWVQLSARLVGQEQRERQEALRRQQARERRERELVRSRRQLEVNERRLRGSLADYNFLAGGIVAEEYAARGQLEEAHKRGLRYYSPAQCARRARRACEREALAARDEVMAEEGVERLFVTDAYQRQIVPYLQMLQEQRRALVGEEEQVRARELRDELDLREEVARYHEQYIAPYLAMRQRHIAERNELCQQEYAARGFGPGQCIRLHAMPWLLRGIAAEEVRERNELMRGHQNYLEQCEREQEERLRVACDALCGQEERARRSLQHEEDRMRSSQFLNFWIIRSLRLQGRYVPRGHDTVTNRFEGTNAREMMERLELLTSAQLDELELRELLDMPVHCSHNDVKAAYRRFCLANHPDKTRELPERERQSRAAKLAKMTDIYKCVDGRAQLRQTSAAEVARKRDAELEALRQKHREQLASHDRYALEELRVIPMTSLLWSMRNAALNRERRDIVASQEREMRRFLAENPGSPA